MSLQGPLIVVAEQPAAGLVEALSAAGAFPIVEAKWADAPAAFLTVKPAAIIIAEPGPPANVASARMLCLQVATLNGPIVPVIARVRGNEDAAIPIAMPDRRHAACRTYARSLAIGHAYTSTPCDRFAPHRAFRLA